MSSKTVAERNTLIKSGIGNIAITRTSSHNRHIQSDHLTAHCCTCAILRRITSNFRRRHDRPND